MFATSDFLTVLFGSLSGIAALIIAINTVQLRREKSKIEAGETRMNTFEIGQASLQAALVRSDSENEHLRAELVSLRSTIRAQDSEIFTLSAKIVDLEIQIKELTGVD